MAKTLDEVIAALPVDERRKIEGRAKQLIAGEMSHQDLRKAVGKTQAAVAKRLKVGQDAVSKLETRSDMYISTLRGFVKAIGGELTLVVQFPDRPPVCLEELGTFALRRTPRQARPAPEEVKRKLKLLEFNDESEDAAFELLKLGLRAVQIIFHGGRTPKRHEVLNMADVLHDLETRHRGPCPSNMSTRARGLLRHCRTATTIPPRQTKSNACANIRGRNW